VTWIEIVDFPFNIGGFNMNNSIRKKLGAGFGVCLLLMVGLVAFNISAFLRLEHLYHETLRCSGEMELATDAQHIGEDLYMVIANAVINRDMATSERDWAAAKTQNREKLRQVAAASGSPQELAKLKEAGVALDDIVNIFEREMLPLIKKGAQVPGPLSAIDARIDARIGVIVQALQWVARSVSADNSRASKEFHVVLTKSISVGLVISLFGVAASLLISTLTTRRIVRPMAEITRAAQAVAQGNYQVELDYRSSDEAGTLAHAFRVMTGEVARHTVRLQDANERLNREVRERKLSEEEVNRLNARLEARVAERTAELSRTNERLESVILAQQQSELELQRSRSELRGLTQHLQEVREDERSAIAREIHDELGQLLTALKIDLSWLGKKMPEDQRLLLNKTMEISRRIDDTIGTVQRISAELRPGILDDLGLHAAMEWQAQEFQTKTGVVCEVQGSFQSAGLERRYSTVLFRIFQETLTNIYRHSAATRAKVTLRQRGQALVMTVRDNGCGVIEAKISDPKSLGFIGMRERVRFLGGKLAIRRLPEGGTSIQVVIPLEEKPADKAV